MVFRIELHKGRWLVFWDGVRVFSAGYRQVGDWLDCIENTGRYSASFRLLQKPAPATDRAAAARAPAASGESSRMLG
jgi:hypothetical protein